MICGGPGVSDAYYCKECTVQEKDVSAFFSYLNSFVHQGCALSAPGGLWSPLFKSWIMLSTG